MELFSGAASVACKGRLYLQKNSDFWREWDAEFASSANTTYCRSWLYAPTQMMISMNWQTTCKGWRGTQSPSAIRAQARRWSSQSPLSTRRSELENLRGLKDLGGL